MCRRPSVKFQPHASAQHAHYTSILDKPPRHAHTTAMNTPDYISYSQFTTWLQCGEKYRLTRIIGVEEDPAWYFAGGTAVHSAADAIDHALLEGK